MNEKVSISNIFDAECILVLMLTSFAIAKCERN